MKLKKTSFFIRIKDAIVNFDQYKTFAEEKLGTTIKFILKLILIFSLILTIALSYKFIKQVEDGIYNYKNECPEFRIENNTLIIEEENKKFIKGDENGYFGIFISSEIENLSDIQESYNYERVIAALKDKIILRNGEGIESSITYKELNNRYNINSINKQTVADFISSSKMISIYVLFIIILAICICIVYVIQFLLDILLLSVVGYLLSKIIGVNFKYKSIFNMSVYALTLSIILYMIYLIANLFTGFTINYFEIAYNLISYIYIITAMLTIKSDLIKQQIEVGKIVEEQKKIREEKKEEEKEKQDKTKDKNEKEKQKNKKSKSDKSGEDEAPEGSKA